MATSFEAAPRSSSSNRRGYRLHADHTSRSAATTTGDGFGRPDNRCHPERFSLQAAIFQGGAAPGCREQYARAALLHTAPIPSCARPRSTGRIVRRIRKTYWPAPTLDQPWTSALQRRFQLPVLDAKQFIRRRPLAAEQGAPGTPEAAAQLIRLEDGRLG